GPNGFGAESCDLARGVGALQRGQVHAADGKIQGPELRLLLDGAPGQRRGALLGADLVDRAHAAHERAELRQGHRDSHLETIIHPPRTSALAGRVRVRSSASVRLKAIQTVDRAAPGGHEWDLCHAAAAVADDVVHGALVPAMAVGLPAGGAAIRAPARL